MGKKRKFTRFIRWIKSDLPEENSSVLLLGVKKLPSPTVHRCNSTKRPHTLHFDFPISRSSTLSSKLNDTLDNTHSSFNDLNSIPKTPPDIYSQTNDCDKTCDCDVRHLPEYNSRSLFSNSKNSDDSLKLSFYPATEDKSDRKRVSFSDDDCSLINPCHNAKSRNNLNGNVSQTCIKSHSEVNDCFAELPISYWNNYAQETDAHCSSAANVNTFNKVSVSQKTTTDSHLLTNECRNNLQADENLKSQSGRTSHLRGRKASIDKNDVDEILNAIENELIGPKPRSNSLKSDTVDHSKGLCNNVVNFSGESEVFGIQRRSKSLSFGSCKKHKLQYFRHKSNDTTTPDLCSSLRISEEDLKSNSHRFNISADCTPCESKNFAKNESKRRFSKENICVTNKDIGNVLSEIIEELAISPRYPQCQSEKSENKANTNNDTQFSEVSCTDIETRTSNEKENNSIHSSIMDRSIDSIGSCSLDVDMSTDFSDSSIGSISDCTLRSVSILTPVSNGQQSLIENKIPVPADKSKQCILKNKSCEDHVLEPIIKITDFEVTSKKPSYLNLACCVSGYNNLTTYDSKLRENYRAGAPKSREVSPNRPFSAIDNYATPISKSESNFLTPDLTYNRKILSSDIKVKSPNMAGSQQYSYINQSPDIGEKNSYVMMQNGTSQTYSSSTTTSKSFMSTESRSFASTKLFNEPSTSIDTTDSSAFKTFEKSHKFLSSINTNTMMNSNFKTSKTVTTTIKTVVNGTQQSISDTNISETYSQSPCKSFIQQRVERLYGPGALAQGFFISTKRNKNRTSESEMSEDGVSKTVQSSSIEKMSNKDIGLESTYDFDSCSSDNDNNPSLPVLRHLRPEFRAQLPIMSPKRFSTDKNYQEVPVTPKTNGSHGTVDALEPSANNTFITYENQPETINELKHAKAVENFVNIIKDSKNSSQTCDRNLADSQISLESLTEYLPAAAQVVLPVPVPSTVVTKSDEISKEVPADEYAENSTSDEVLEIKDGHYFLKILKNETDRLIHLAEQVETELETKKNELPDDILGYLRSASGKARLLVSQKMQQFEGLCHKNINQLDEEPFPTTTEDLQGFWDMVMLQVNQVNDLFKDLNELRDNNWIEVKTEEKLVTDSTQIKRKVALPKKINTANSEAQRKQRELQRKKMLEQKRKAMAARKQNQEVDQHFQNIEIFVPDTAMSSS